MMPNEHMKYVRELTGRPAVAAPPGTDALPLAERLSIYLEVFGGGCGNTLPMENGKPENCPDCVRAFVGLLFAVTVALALRGVTGADMCDAVKKAVVKNPPEAAKVYTPEEIEGLPDGIYHTYSGLDLRVSRPNGPGTYPVISEVEFNQPFPTNHFLEIRDRLLGAGSVFRCIYCFTEVNGDLSELAKHADNGPAKSDKDDE